MTAEVYHLLPEILLASVAMIILLGGTTPAGARSGHWPVVAVIGLGAALVLWFVNPSVDLPRASSLTSDDLAQFMRGVIMILGVILVLLAVPEVPLGRGAEFFSILLLTLVGIMLVTSANELILLFLGLELVALPSYLLIYLPRHDPAAQEASTKYFFLGIFAAAILLYGFSFLYGLTGTTNLSAMADVVSRSRQTLASEGATAVPAGTQMMFIVAVVLTIAGLAFKIAAVPFHWYVPDVYQGAPTSVTALLAFGPKAAGFIALMRILGTSLWAFEFTWFPILCVLCVATMTLGNVMGLLQKNVKRMLAYSSIAHSGYMLMGFVAVGGQSSVQFQLAGGMTAVVFYLVVYGFMTIGAFAVLSALSQPGKNCETLDDLAGISKSRLGMSLALALFMFSLIGLPLTAGFVGKFCLFGALLEAGGSWSTAHGHGIWNWYTGLAVVGGINAAIAGYYYLRVVTTMFLRDPGDFEYPPAPVASRFVIGVCAAAVLFLGLLPRATFLGAQRAARSITAARETQTTKVPGNLRSHQISRH